MICENTLEGTTFWTDGYFACSVGRCVPVAHVKRRPEQSGDCFRRNDEKIHRKPRIERRWRKMLKAYKYRIYPNEEQKLQIAKTFGCCRFVYNQTLAYRKEAYENEKKSVSKTDCNNYCNRELKKEYEWLKEVDKFALTNAIYNMDAAYQKFFREHAAFLDILY